MPGLNVGLGLKSEIKDNIDNMFYATSLTAVVSNAYDALAKISKLVKWKQDRLERMGKK